jgi:hypothetical protein
MLFGVPWRAREATQQGARVIIVRAGDFFGPRARQSWLSQGLLKPEQPVESINLPED